MTAGTQMSDVYDTTCKAYSNKLLCAQIDLK